MKEHYWIMCIKKQDHYIINWSTSSYETFTNHKLQRYMKIITSKRYTKRFSVKKNQIKILTIRSKRKSLIRTKSILNNGYNAVMFKKP